MTNFCSLDRCLKYGGIDFPLLSIAE